ncbi:leukocyte elastase inhibitor-like [Biomphalaria glabrata]|uniref:Leukocyte elastase inhibitor-like n=1 Tax=Biomphalaria glabrata TaxID=6526 RepID=A0A9W2ZMU2_BIOGL|nr:leukocyte elastase inhibitor-like [Biomphalaria glabrata]XP_055876233.1 leukocyte elastase inhibitor-like [Biomphalaria glabrata]
MAHQLIADANNKFGLDLFKLTHNGSKGENLFLSPFSISLALAMTQVGAREKTAQDMAKALRWETEEETKIHEQFQSYLKLIQSPTDAYQLSTANRLYLQQSYVFLEEFKNKIITWYLAEPISADFVSNAENERVQINDWVAGQTNNKILDLLAPGVLDSLTRMVLVNAIYFKGQWNKKFKESDTRSLPFKLSPGQTKNVPMMIMTSEFSYTDDPDLKVTAVEIPYKGKELGMVILLPDEDTSLESVVNNLTWEKLKTIFDGLAYPGSKVKLTLPKFEMTSSLDLKSLLSSLGMEVAFNVNCADFSGMTGGKDLYISAAVHKAFIQVNEEGTEAAAATAVVMMMRCAVPQPPPITIDRPFLFLIRDIRANNILFLGQVTDPSP